MKTLAQITLPIVFLIFSTSLSVAQDYKHPFGLVDKKGLPTNQSSNKALTKGKTNYVSTEGKIINPETGEANRRIGKNESFIYYFKKTPAIKWKNDKCEAKSSYFPILHETYKHAGICNYHCLLWYKKN